MRIALTGATGIAGRFICAELLARGCELKALSRTAWPTNNKHLIWLTGHLEDNASLDALVQGCDALVHCALGHKPGHYRGGEGTDVAGFWRINLLGTIALLEAAAKADVKRVVLLSSRAVFTGSTQQPGCLYDDAPHKPDTHYGALKSAIEGLAKLYSKNSTTIVVLRPTGIYGLLNPTTDSKWYDLAKNLLLNRPITEVKTGTEVHGQDLASALWLLLNTSSEQLNPCGYNCSDIEISTRELVAMMLAELGTKAELPAKSPAVTNPMICQNLQALGWQPGGRVLLRQTIKELLVAAAT